MVINGGIFTKSGVPFMQRFLKTAATKQKVTAANVANVSTVGYQARQVDFKKEMQRYLSNDVKTTVVTTTPRHMRSSGSPDGISIEFAENEENSSGVNNVDIEKEMASLAENQLLYEFGAKRLSRMFNTLRMAIRGKNA